VRVEGIEIMTEFLTCIKKKLVEAEYVTNVEKLLRKATDPITADEIRVRVARLSGRILVGFSHHMFATAYHNLFMDFFKTALQDKCLEVRVAVAYNLPCFYFTYKNHSEATSLYFDQTYLDLSEDPSIEV